MDSSRAFRIVLFILLFLTTFATAGDSSASSYRKGTITQNFSPTHKSYELRTGDEGYQINPCGEFQSGQIVDYRVNDDKLYIRREDGKEYKCTIEATLTPTAGSSSAKAVPTYEKGTIEGYEVRRDTHIGGGGGGGGGTPGNPVTAWTRHAKVYELHGTDLIYKVDYCGAFQAGKFAAGDMVEYRVAGDRVYIRHDNDKEYSCQLEGTKKPEDVKPEATAQPATPTGSSAPSMAKLSIASVPDGADIAVDGNFSGNTPSDLSVPEGEHSITVSKSGFKNWQRKMIVVAGSSIHINAELEKATTP